MGKKIGIGLGVFTVLALLGPVVVANLLGEGLDLTMTVDAFQSRNG